MGNMQGKDWAVVILVAILVVLLSTMSSWWGQLVFILGFKMALIVISIVIAILVIAIIAMMVAAPDWWDNLFTTLVGNADQVVDVAVQGTEKAANAMVGITANLVSKLGLFALIGGGCYLVVKNIGSRNEKNNLRHSNS